MYNHVFFPSIANLKCTPADRQMYPSLGTPDLKQESQMQIARRAKWELKVTRGPNYDVNATVDIPELN